MQAEQYRLSMVRQRAARIGAGLAGDAGFLQIVRGSSYSSEHSRFEVARADGVVA
jgi:hypothetical protein